jgi:hypothetical protein
MAGEWELHHRVAGEDSRIGWLTKQLDLIGRLSPAWEARLREEDGWLLRELGLG